MEARGRPIRRTEEKRKDRDDPGLEDGHILRGDLDRAKEWYGAVLGKKPYFDEPFYGGFEVGGFELSLRPQEPGGPGLGGEGLVAYWGVEDADAAYARLLELGASERGGVQDVGGGIRVATVLDPFGNVFGVIENPHFSLGGV